MASTSRGSQEIDEALLETTNIELQYVFDSDAGELFCAVYFTATANLPVKYADYDNKLLLSMAHIQQ